MKVLSRTVGVKVCPMSSSPHKTNQIKGWIGGGGGGTEGLEAQHVATLDGTCKKKEKEKKTQGNDRSSLDFMPQP